MGPNTYKEIGAVPVKGIVPLFARTPQRPEFLDQHPPSFDLVCSQLTVQQLRQRKSSVSTSTPMFSVSTIGSVFPIFINKRAQIVFGANAFSLNTSYKAIMLEQIL